MNNTAQGVRHSKIPGSTASKTKGTMQKMRSLCKQTHLASQLRTMLVLPSFPVTCSKRCFRSSVTARFLEIRHSKRRVNTIFLTSVTIYPSLQHRPTLFKVILVSSVPCGRDFSLINRVKTYQRSRLTVRWTMGLLSHFGFVYTNIILMLVLLYAFFVPLTQNT